MTKSHLVNKEGFGKTSGSPSPRSRNSPSSKQGKSFFGQRRARERPRVAPLLHFRHPTIHPHYSAELHAPEHSQYFSDAHAAGSQRLSVTLSTWKCNGRPLHSRTDHHPQGACCGGCNGQPLHFQTESVTADRYIREPRILAHERAQRRTQCARAGVGCPITSERRAMRVDRLSARP